MRGAYTLDRHCQMMYGAYMALVQTRIPEGKLAKLARVAKRNERSVAAELRVAIDRHLESESHPRGETK